MNPFVEEWWYVLSAISAAACAVLLLLRHVFERRLPQPVRRVLDLIVVPLFAIFIVYVVSRPFL